MRTLLINPCLRPYSQTRVVPVGLACVATALDRAGQEFDILDVDLNRYDDAEVDAKLAERRYDVVGLGTISSSYRVTKALCQQVKRAMPDTVLVVGNTVATSIPELLMDRVPEVDIGVLGEGDRTIVELCEAIAEGRELDGVNGLVFRRGGSVVFTAERTAYPCMEDVPFPDLTLFEFDRYLEISATLVPEPTPLPREQMRAVPINTARGCPFDCTFCTHAFKRYKYRYYAFDSVVEEFGRYQDRYGANYLAFYDELTLATKKRVHELCDSIEASGREFWWSINPRGNLFKREDLGLLKRCRDLGAIVIGGALESGSPEILAAMNKKLDPADFIEQMLAAREAGINRLTSLVFGYPQETPETIRLTVDICRRCEVYPSVGFILPLPGTPIYRQAQERGLIGDEEEYLLRIGDRQDLHINLTSMTDEQLLGTVTEELIRLKDDLGVPLSDEQVIKTTFYRTSAKAAK
jgi:anaerobic magnesium-protoporphyrin IX monomethyl ester cyclase